MGNHNQSMHSLVSTWHPNQHVEVSYFNDVIKPNSDVADRGRLDGGGVPLN